MVARRRACDAACVLRAAFLVLGSFTLLYACGQTIEPANAPLDAGPALRSGLADASHATCSDDRECPDGEACGYLGELGCDAAGECVTGSRNHCGAPAVWVCGCEGQMEQLDLCLGLPPAYGRARYRTIGACPNPRTGTCDPVGTACTPGQAYCCLGLQCGGDAGSRCCKPQGDQCAHDEECCPGTRCLRDPNGDPGLLTCQ